MTENNDSVTRTNGTEQLDVRVEMTKTELERFWNAEYEVYVEEHEGASFHSIFDHDHYGYIGFSVHTCPGDGDLLIKYSEWEQETHHEIDDRMVWVPKEDDWR